jgi:heme exporter protein A
MISSLLAENLALRRGNRLLFSNLSFAVQAGEAVAVEGANGAGKTSLLRLIAGFLNLEAGRLTLVANGRTISEGEERGAHIGWLGHQEGLKPQLTAREQLRFYAQLYRHGGEVTGFLEEVGLLRQAELSCRYLSAGQKRRLGLARLLASNRPLWLLDEPFAALDTAGKELVGRLIVRHCAGGGMVLAATHEPLAVATRSLCL